MTHAELIGNHLPGNGEGITVQDPARPAALDPGPGAAELPPGHDRRGGSLDVTGIGIGQSDQAEKWEFKIYLKTTG